MKNLWTQKEAKLFSKGDLSLRVYSSRLLGRNPELVLHGGGNTSVKGQYKNIFGEITETLFIKGLTLFLSESAKLNVKVVNNDVVLFKSIDKENSYSESGIIDRKTGELIHEITRNIKTENSEKDISFYSCIKKKENV